jgi:RRXRR protein
MRLSPIKAVSQELVKFDTQLTESPEISGMEYQQGELAGYEVREYRAMCKSLTTSGEGRTLPGSCPSLFPIPACVIGNDGV